MWLGLSRNVPLDVSVNIPHNWVTTSSDLGQPMVQLLPRCGRIKVKGNNQNLTDGLPIVAGIEFPKLESLHITMNTSSVDPNIWNDMGVTCIEVFGAGRM